MERIFVNSQSPAGFLTVSGQPLDTSDPDTYEATVRALIQDAADYEESELSREREIRNKYYYAQEPALATDSGAETYNSYDATPEGEVPNKSTIISTDVRDTIQAILPSLMRIFAGTEHAIDFQPTSEANDELAKQQTDYIRYKFWEECDGFLVLYTAFKDALLHSIGVITWGTDTSQSDFREETFQNLTIEQIAMLLSENENNEIVDYGVLTPSGQVTFVTLRFYKSKPSLWVEAVPLEEFRVNRSAKSVKTADLIGRERYRRASDLIEEGYDPEIVLSHVGASRPFSSDRSMRAPYSDTFEVFGDLVRFGDYYVRIDKDGDGIAELRRITTIGDDFQILDDYVANKANYAVFGPDPTQHTLIGDNIADIVMDIQRINTNLIRGTLDSLAQSINPKTVINETLVNVDDALNEDLGAIIRTRGDTTTSVTTVTTPFMGKDAMVVAEFMEARKAARTGISDASRGLDPKALQSTAVMGVDLIASGAQERIELIARIFAETGLKDLYNGLLEEIINHQNEPETVQLRGKWVNVDPSTFDASLKLKVNPALGKGSDMVRLMALNAIKQDQLMIIGKFGIGNGVVGVEEFRNTIQDMAEIANIRNISRYFRKIDPAKIAAIESAPKEPSPEELLAKAEYEKVKSDVIKTQAEIAQKDRKLAMDDDFRRDELNVNAFLDLVGIMAEFATAESPDESVSEQQSLNQPG